jgi:hypothetical protein
MQASNTTHRLSPACWGGCKSIKVKICDKKKSELPLAPADPWRGLGTETPPTRAHWLIKIPPKSFFFSNKIQSTPRDHGGLGLPLRHECKLQTQDIGSPEHVGEGEGA